jgi:cAMP-dependent protein kinase regulator
VSGAEVERLKAAASDALKRGQHPLALRHCLDLEKLEPNDPMWPRRTALVLERMGRTRDEIDALDRSAANYERAGDVLKCATVCNQILQRDISHAPTKERMVRIHRINRPKARSNTPNWKSPEEKWISEATSGIKDLNLRRVAASRPATTRAGVYHIPLTADGDDLALELSGGLSGDLPLHMAADLELTLDARGNVTARAAAQVRREVAAEDEAIRAVEAEFKEAVHTNAALTATPLFVHLTEKSFSELLQKAQPIALEKDQEVFHQGDPGDALFVIAEGTVGVIDEGPPRRGLSKLKEGEFFGEMAMLSDSPRNATCVALEPTHLIRLDRAVMKKLIATDPQVLPVLLRFFRDRSVERLMATNPLFTVLSSKDRDAVRSKFRFLEAEAGATLIVEGTQSEGLLVMLAGRAEVKRTVEGKAVVLGTLGPGDVGGEMSILTESPAIAGVVATENCFVAELPAAMFLRIVKSRPKAMEFIQRIAARRASQAKAILAGQGNFRQGSVDVI